MRIACMLAIALLLLVPVAAIVAKDEAEKEPAAEPKKPAVELPVMVMKTSMGDIRMELFPDEAPKTVKTVMGLAEGTIESTDPKTGEKTKRPFYDGLIFHRVIKDFMLQGGCPNGDGSGNPGFMYEDEISAKSLGLDKLMAVQGPKPHPWLGAVMRSQQDFHRMVLTPLFKKMGIKSQEDLNAKRAEVQKALEALTLEDVYTGMGYKYDNTRNSHAPKRGFVAMANAGPGTNGSQFFIILKDAPWLTGKHTVVGRVIEGMDVVDEIGAVKVGPKAKPVEDVKILSFRQEKK